MGYPAVSTARPPEGTVRHAITSSIAIMTYITTDIVLTEQEVEFTALRAQIIRQVSVQQKKRKATRPTRAARAKRMDTKCRRGQLKALRKKVG